MSPYKELFDNWDFWSFSRLQKYEHCPYCFYKYYIEKDRDEIPNFYAENGTLIHELIDKMVKGEVDPDDSPEIYLNEFESLLDYYGETTEICNARDRCLDFLAEVAPGNNYLATDEYNSSLYNIIGTEMKMFFHVDDEVTGPHRFVGYIDMLLQNKENGEYVVVDHKSSRGFFRKDGNPLKTSLETLRGYEKQMATYCMALEQNGYPRPVKAIWNHFQYGKIDGVVVNDELIDTTKKWCFEMFRRIYEDEIYDGDIEQFFHCSKLCGYRNRCEVKAEKIEEKRNS